MNISKILDFLGIDLSIEDDMDEPEQDAAPVISVEKPRPIKPKPPTIKKDTSPQGIIIYELSNVGECRLPADMLKKGYAVIVNYTSMQSSEARSAYSFLLGLCYTIGGSYTKLSKDIYLYSPGKGCIEMTKKGEVSLENTLAKMRHSCCPKA